MDRRVPGLSFSLLLSYERVSLSLSLCFNRRGQPTFFAKFLLIFPATRAPSSADTRSTRSEAVAIKSNLISDRTGLGLRAFVLGTRSSTEVPEVTSVLRDRIWRSQKLNIRCSVFDDSASDFRRRREITAWTKTSFKLDCEICRGS